MYAHIVVTSFNYLTLS